MGGLVQHHRRGIGPARARVARAQGGLRHAFQTAHHLGGDPPSRGQLKAAVAVFNPHQGLFSPLETPLEMLQHLLVELLAALRGQQGLHPFKGQVLPRGLAQAEGTAGGVTARHKYAPTAPGLPVIPQTVRFPARVQGQNSRSAEWAAETCRKTVVGPSLNVPPQLPAGEPRP